MPLSQLQPPSRPSRVAPTAERRSGEPDGVDGVEVAVEAADAVGGPAAADVIARAAGPGKGDSFAALGAAAGTLCAVLISRSIKQGTPSLETQESIERFRQVLEDALADPSGHSIP